MHQSNLFSFSNLLIKLIISAFIAVFIISFELEREYAILREEEAIDSSITTVDTTTVLGSPSAKSWMANDTITDSK